MPIFTPQDFARSFATTPEDVLEKCGDLLAKLDFSYTPLEGPERDELLLRILKLTDADRQTVGAPERQEVWERGWQENLDHFAADPGNLEVLLPRFIRGGQPVRLDRRYVQPGSFTFELDYLQVLRQWLFLSFFRQPEMIYEFGCGTGFNLVALAQLFPDKTCCGLDFVASSVALVNQVGQIHRLKLAGRLFDMIRPDPSLALAPGSAVLTIGSLEQLAGNILPFMDYLLAQPISVCVHVEPVLDFYDEAHLEDYLAIRFQSRRGYTRNLHAQLQAMESAGQIELLMVKRLNFGSLFMEGYNCLVWRPRG